MKITSTLLASLALLFMASRPVEKAIEFKYPKRKNATIYMDTDNFKKFKKEWRGEDYYYLSQNSKNDMVCSVLFYKLDEEEKLMYVDIARVALGTDAPENSPVYPLIYFTTYSKLAKLESNKSKWGDPSEDFMFSHSDIEEFQGVKVNQKHMYAYAMYDKDLFVSIHLSKVNCTPGDSILMRGILEGISKKK